jgi:hypothetical protein
MKPTSNEPKARRGSSVAILNHARNLTRKEVISVAYTKPVLTGYFAITTVQTTGQNQKTSGAFEPGLSVRTSPAYEADE